MRRMICDTSFIRELQALIDETPPCHERALAQQRLDRAVELLEALPRKVAAAGPFATSAQARTVLDREIRCVLAAIDG
jgi:hypothetical protein